MKSFLRGLKNVGKFATSPQFMTIAGLVSKVAPVPGLGIGISILQKITEVESHHADDDKATSQQKAEAFMADFETTVAAANLFFARDGKRAVYDVAKMAAARDAMVTAVNLARDAQESMDIVDLEP